MPTASATVLVVGGLFVVVVLVALGIPVVDGAMGGGLGGDTGGVPESGGGGGGVGRPRVDLGRMESTRVAMKHSFIRRRFNSLRVAASCSSNSFSLRALSQLSIIRRSSSSVFLLK